MIDLFIHFFSRRPITVGQAASRLSQEAKTVSHARRIAKMNELRADLHMPAFVPTDPRLEVR